jgi:hypothetical protein
MGPISKKTPLEGTTHVEDGGYDLLLSREEKVLTLFIVIVSVATRFKRRRVYTLLTNTINRVRTFSSRDKRRS